MKLVTRDSWDAGTMKRLGTFCTDKFVLSRAERCIAGIAVERGHHYKLREVLSKVQNRLDESQFVIKT